VENTAQPSNTAVNQEGKTVGSWQHLEQELERNRIWYEQRLEKMRQGNRPLFIEAVRIAELLSEPNTLGVHRLLEVFGPELVSAKAEEAITLFQKAKTQGPEVYQPSEEGTVVATKKGQPRTVGGIFFYLMHQHSDRLGLVWMGLNLPKVQWMFLKPRPNSKNKMKEPPAPAAVPPETSTEKPVPEKGVAQAANQGQSKTSVEKKALVQSSVPASKTPSITQPSAQGSEKKANQSTEAASKLSSNVTKPARATLKVVGPLVGKPKPQPNGQVGIIELVLKTEMNVGLPKGLPNLGSTRIVVWCTEKQFNKIKNTITAESRFIAEGEIAAAVGADLTPFVRLICLKLSTVEYDQALRSSTEQKQSVS
jgi:hypothetical protein